MKARAYKLMKEWCDTLLSYQIKTATPYTSGALLCPACHVLHGRCADLCFPLTVIWSKTNDEKYLERADELIDWSEFNLKTPDSLWYNDITNRWYATSAFSAMSIGEALYHFDDTLPKKYKNKWLSIFTRMADVFSTLDTRDSFKPVTNYYCGISALLAMATKITGDDKYVKKSKYWLDVALSRIDSEGLLYGEGYPVEASDGSHTVDMGYDLEESIPLLLRYSSLTGDRPEFFRKMLRDHLEFLLPDGAIDNSFGVRHNKWTYWGSRTSDGLIEGLALVLDDAVFATACEKALTLYEKCTQNGLLSMPMASEFGEPTCLHHTFTHAKALAALICSEIDVKGTDARLPCEEKYGIKKYQNEKLVLVSHGVFRATFSASLGGYIQSYNANAGGSMNLLYHDKYGIICAATTAEYIPTEQLNQQYLRNSECPPSMTPMFFVKDKQACYDKTARLFAENENVIATGDGWSAEYIFSSDCLRIELKCESGIYSIPIVCSKNQQAFLSEDGKTLSIENGISMFSSTPFTVDTEKRIFHQVGGLSYLPVSISVKEKATILIK